HERPDAGAARAARVRYLWDGVRRADAGPQASRRHPHMAIPDRLARKLDALPDKPGVYLWKSAVGETLYVGKAKSLRSRVPSYFGPDGGATPERAALRQTLRIIRRIFTVRSCHWDLPRDAPARPCLDYHIERCRAPCVGYQSEADYRRMIDDAVLFLEGKTVDVRMRLRERMHQASQQLDFERAAQVRDARKWLDQLEQPQAVELIGRGDADAGGLDRDGDDGAGVVP